MVKKGGDKTNLEIIAVVAIVAIVAIFVLFLNAGGKCHGKLGKDGFLDHKSKFGKEGFTKEKLSEKVAPEGIAEEASVEAAGSSITGAVVGLPTGTSWGGLDLPAPPPVPGVPDLS
tara:strand:+ start:6653 stop:7000 length:348 start_codon:yes stop_codon:yes gene_type:complete